MEGRIYSIDDFSRVYTDKLRYRDTDRQGHVNNAVFSTFFETGRVEILYSRDEPLYSKGCSFVIASIKLDFLNEMSWPGEIQIGTSVKRVGRSSLSLFQGLFQNGDSAALAETVIVHVNNLTRKSQPLSEEAVRRLEELVG